MANNVVDILKGVVGELREIANSETIVGDPITVGDKTVVPIVKISVGFGAGGGQGENEKAGTGFGGGGGGGARIEPAAFIIMDKDGVSLLPVSKGKLDTIIDTIPDLARKLSKMKDKFTSDKENASKTDKSAKTEESAEKDSE